MLRVEGLTKEFAEKGQRGKKQFRAIDDTSFSVEKGELFTLLGPSGCGKTTTLRCIAGLEMPDVGEIEVDGRIVFSSASNIRINANERGLGMVFQSYAIWPHMNVFKNVAFPLRVRRGKRRVPRAEIAARVERALEAVRLSDFASRPATDLSGGQQQRLALARALVMEPPLLLLDEPLSNLDAKLREDMRLELKRVQRELGITAIYVTHDQVEALAMSTRIAVMNKGRIDQIGVPRDIYDAPETRFVADFIGTTNFVEGKVASADGTSCVVDTQHGSLRVVTSRPYSPGDAVLVSMRPEHLTVEVADAEARAETGQWLGVVDEREFLGEAVNHRVSVNDYQLHVRTNPSVSVEPGRKVAVGIKDEACSLVPM